MGKKVKVVYDVDGIMKKKKGTNKEKNSRFGKANIIALITLIAAEVIYYYFAVPAISIYKVSFWIWMIITFACIFFVTMDFSLETKGKNKKEKDNRLPVYSIILAGITGLCLIVVVIGGFLSSRLVSSSKYAGLIRIEEGDFNRDIVKSDNVNDIALMDTDSAIILGDRAIGSLSDVVSQYEVSEEYSTIDYQGRPMKVASLEYAGFIKFMNNRDNGIPGYVLVDPVKNEAYYVELKKPIRYSESACFKYDLQRHIQTKYPTYDFYGAFFELDNEGNPYYICPVLKPNAGLFGAKDVTGIVICDPCSGDCEYMDVEDVPNWVDRVYDGDLACDKYNWYGKLSGGFINSIFGNKGCKVTTDDYGYKVMDGDVWVYTGVTSVNGDQSNIGFVMMNSRTGDSKYYAITGAEEHSAMESAEGQVQNLGYTASFPSLINIDGIPTYIMVMKDNAGLVKMYAMVNVEKYNIVATGNTQREVLNNYRKLMVENGIATGEDIINDQLLEKEITVKDIKYINMDGETYVYITAGDGSVYKQSFNDNEALIFIQPEDLIMVYYVESDNGINELVSYTQKRH